MIVVEHGQLPDGRRATILIAGGRIEYVGELDARALARLVECDVVDAGGCVVAPGLIDPHQHLIGGSGEEGFASQTAEIAHDRLLASGITTVVGTLGTDTTTRTLPGLLAKVKGLRERGVHAWMWSGGYDARPLTGSIRDDVILIEEIIGAGEIAVADRRGVCFDARALARLAADCYVAGTLANKAGVLHLHVGDGRQRLSIVRELLDDFEVVPQSIYPTHVNRNEELFREAAELTKRGVSVDLDLVDENLGDWIRIYDGDPSMLTISTDAPIGRCEALLEQIRDVVNAGLMTLDDALALATRNTARVLKLHDAGEIAAGRRADLLLLDANTLQIRRAIVAGRLTT